MNASKSDTAPAPNVSVQDAVDGLPQGTLVLDEELCVLRANTRYCALLGTNEQETVGHPLYQLSAGLWDRADVRAAVARVLGAGGPDEAIELPPAGTLSAPLFLQVRRLKADPGQGAVLLVVDDVATRADPIGSTPPEGEKEDLVSRAAHELRGSMGSIANWVHLLSESSQDGALLQQGLAAIRRALKTGTEVLDALNDLSQLRRGRLRIRTGLVDLASVLDLLLEGPRAAAKEKGIAFEVVREVASQPVMGDPARLQQILLHLLDNAVRFTPAGGTIEVTVGRDAAAWRLAVRDTGRGISATALPGIFDGTRRPDRKVDFATRGLGVGLAIARHLALLHGGTIEASSPGIGCGSTFVLRLPIPALIPSSPPTRNILGAMAERPLGAAALRS